MIIPLKTDRINKRRPVVTETLIITNLLVYLIIMAGHYGGMFDIASAIGLGRYEPLAFNPLNLITYQFLHDPNSIFHVAFNMLFLWVFGCAVEDRLGRIGFIAFYLIGGSVAALAHGMVTNAPVIGASGSVAAVSGAFLALFPRSQIKILFVFFFIGVFTIPSLYLIGFYFLLDLLNQLTSFLGGNDRGVAYAAHIAGSVYGFTVCFIGLVVGLFPRDEFDIFYLFKQSRRRAAFRAANREATNATWATPAKATDAAPKKLRAETKVKPPRPAIEQTAIDAARKTITDHLNNYETEKAASAYATMLDRYPDVVLTEPRQLDVASQLYKSGDAQHAAAAYELFLKHYNASQNAAEVALLLGVLYARKLDKADRARELIDKAKKHLRDAAQLALADQIAAELAT